MITMGFGVYNISNVNCCPLKLVLDCANQCHSVLGIQLAVTACLYDLSKAKTGKF